MSENLSFLAKRTALQSRIEDKINKNSLLGTANDYGAKSFYDFLRPEDKNKKIHLCSGTACLMSGKVDEIKRKILKDFKEEEIGEVNCLGHCFHNNAYFENFQLNFHESSEDIHHLAQLESPILLGQSLSIQELHDAIKYALEQDPSHLLNEMTTSGLRGRGGAGFPMATKLEICQNTPSSEKYIIVNGDEGDPGSYSDRFLLENRPDLILFGLLVSGYIIGAQTGIVYIRGEYPKAQEVMNTVIENWRELGFLGENIMAKGHHFDVIAVQGAGSYVCGEETALIASIEGKRPEVSVRPPYPSTKGLFNKPTVVNNVETIANLYSIITKTGYHFSQIGTTFSTGTKLISLSSLFNKPGVYEVEMGTPLEYVINNCGKGLKVEGKAIQVGGPLGSIIPLGMLHELHIDFESFEKHGLTLGHGSMILIPKQFPMIKLIEHLFEFTKNESCGKCVPCRLGSAQGHNLIKNSNHKKVSQSIFSELLETMEMTSLCGLGGSIPLSVHNILQYFPQELKPYFEEDK